jgi:hypothetical protein
MVVNWKLAAVAVAVGVGLTGLGAWNVASRPAAAGQPAPAAKANPPAAAATTPPLGPVPIAFDFAFPVEKKPFNLYIGWSDSEPPPAATPPVLRADQPVATIFGDEHVTKEQFAEHLIRRYGKKELQLFVNKRIIERAFARKELPLSADEVHAALEADIKGTGVTRDQFERDVLPKYGKTMTEWVEDVLVPRLMLAKLCKTRVMAPTEEDLRRAFDEKYGEKIDVRMIYYLPVHATAARAEYEKIKSDENAFAAAASGQYHIVWRTTGGRTGAPMPRAALSPPNEQVQAVVARLRPGEVSPLLDAPVIDGHAGGLMVIKCDKVIPADGSKSFAAEKPMLLKEVLEARINREIPKLMDELKREANPQYHLTLPGSVVVPQPTPDGPKK